MKIKKALSLLIVFLSFIQFALSDGYKVPQYTYNGMDVCDIDNDGDIDIIVGSHDQGNDTISILLNDGFGNFSISQLVRSNYGSVICSCINEDDLPDIVTLTRTDSAWVFYPNYGGINFGNSHIICESITEYIEPFSLDEDNSPDFISYDWHIGGGFGTLYNNGVGVFTHYNIYTSSQSISDPAVGDLNGDSLNDILVSDYNGGVFIFYNQGVGVFDQQIVDVNPANFTYIFDIDNDGDNDLGLYDHEYFPGGICTLKIYEKQSDNFVLKKSILFPTGTLFRKFADFNNDGFFDIAYIRGLWGEPIDSLYIVFNNQDMTFSSPDRYFVNITGLLEMEATDFDGNGYIDLAYTYYSSEDSVTVLFNDGTGKFVENPLTSIQSHESQKVDINVFPNPFKNHTTITLTLPESSEISVNIFDQPGRKVMEIQNKWYEKGHQSIDISTPELTPGLYYIELYVNKRQGSSRKLMIL